MSASTQSATAPGDEFIPLGTLLSHREKWLLLIALGMAVLITSLNQQIIATAMPHILADLQGFALLSWVFTSFQLTSTVAMPVTGKLSDIFGRKRLLLTGITIF